MNSGDPSSSGPAQMTPSNSAGGWLGFAVRRGYLSAQQSAELAEEAERSGWDARQLAVERGLVTPVERDIIEALLAPEQVAPGYRVLDVIGCGGLGVVYKAQQLNLDRPVALKTVLVTRLNTPGVLARFQQEAKTIGALRHPNIVTAFDTGTHAGRLYLAMELVEGLDLAQLIQHEKREMNSGEQKQGIHSEQKQLHSSEQRQLLPGEQKLDELRGLWIARQVAGGLAHAAERNIVHRDIKPANILITKAPHGYPLPARVPLAKITDFGLALLAANDDDTRLTLAGTTMGTPNYMAPEQLAGSTVDLRADIFALGATLYQLLTGETPFAGATLAEIVSNRVKGSRRNIATVVEGLSEPTVRLVESMMAEDPADRPADYARLLAMIDEAIRGVQPAASGSEAAPLMAMRFSSGAADFALETGSDPVPTRTMVSVATQERTGDMGHDPRAKPGAMGAARWGKWVALVAMMLAVVGAAMWGITKFSFRGSGGGESPPPSETGREVPLFDGSTLAGWEPRFRGSWGQGRDAEGSFVLQGRATGTQAASIGRALPAPAGHVGKNFRVQLDVDPRDAQRVEILFGLDGVDLRDAPGPQRNHALYLERDRARVGTFDHQSQFQSSGPPADLPPKAHGAAPAYRNVKLDHYSGQWHIYIDDRLIRRLPYPAGVGQFRIGLVVDQGAANFANLELIELAEIAAK
ncbi:MAG: serine/threonine protein kinase [Planctomycetes bacterium]|nr:serine/threonine protein kinase [Planctomycetota bacterium]